MNKWDLLKGKEDAPTQKEYKERLLEELKHIHHAEVMFISGQLGWNLHRVPKTILKILQGRKARVKTSDFNRFIQHVTRRNPPRLKKRAHAKRSEVKIFYGTQTDSGYPNFLLFSNSPQDIQPAYLRFLKKELRKHEPYIGTPIRFLLKDKPGREERPF